MRKSNNRWQVEIDYYPDTFQILERDFQVVASGEQFEPVRVELRDLNGDPLSTVKTGYQVVFSVVEPEGVFSFGVGRKIYHISHAGNDSELAQAELERGGLRQHPNRWDFISNLNELGQAEWSLNEYLGVGGPLPNDATEIGGWRIFARLVKLDNSTNQYESVLNKQANLLNSNGSRTDLDRNDFSTWQNEFGELILESRLVRLNLDDCAEQRKIYIGFSQSLPIDPDWRKEMYDEKVTLPVASQASHPRFVKYEHTHTNFFPKRAHGTYVFHYDASIDGYRLFKMNRTVNSCSYDGDCLACPLNGAP